MNTLIIVLIALQLIFLIKLIGLSLKVKRVERFIRKILKKDMEREGERLFDEISKLVISMENKKEKDDSKKTTKKANG